MNVCLVSGSYPEMRCGVGDYTACLAGALAAQGCDLTVLTSRSPDVQIPAAGRVRVFAEADSWRSGHADQLVRRILDQNPDIVHVQYPACHYGRGGAPARVLARLRRLAPRVGRILTLHEFRDYRPWGRWRLRSLLAGAQRILCTNHMDRRALRDAWPRLRPRLRVIPLGSNVGETPLGFQRPLPASGGRTWLAHFGTVRPNKGWELLLAAWRHLEDHGPRFGLEVIGGLDDRYAYHRRIRSRLRDLCLEPAVRFTGYLPAGEVGQRLGRHALAVLPFASGVSRNRSSLAACLAHRLAVITTAPVCFQEGLRPGHTLWLVPREDPGALADAILRLAGDEAAREHLRRGADEAARPLAWSRIAARVRGEYLNLMAEAA